MFLVIENLSKSFIKYKNTFTAFKDINISVDEGEFLCILGPSGCGKTTLFNIIAGLETPSAGRVSLMGKEVRKAGADRAVVFQEGALFPWLTVSRNIEFSMKEKYRNKKKRTEKIEYYLEMVRLKDFANSYVHELSGGMKQRVAIARALALESEVLLMDEPFSALDNHNRTLLQNELLQIWWETGKTVLFITHNIEEALFLGNRILVMSDSPGRIVSEFKIGERRPRDIESPEIRRYYEEAKKILGENGGYERKEVFGVSENNKEHHVLSDTDFTVGASL